MGVRVSLWALPFYYSPDGKNLEEIFLTIILKTMIETIVPIGLLNASDIPPPPSIAPIITPNIIVITHSIILLILSSLLLNYKISIYSNLNHRLIFYS